jgi:hypothetical protein
MMRKRLLLMAGACVAAAAIGFADCVTWTLSCVACGLTVCTGQTDNSLTSSPLDNCQSPTPLTCSLHRDDAGNRVVCGDANQATQCYQRDIKTSGYRCSDGVIETKTATGCCKG